MESARNISSNLLENQTLEILNISIHYDEKTPHAHVSYRNYYDSKSITNLLKKHYSKAQDLVGEIFSKIGFSRGKKGSTAKHLNTKQMHAKELKNRIIQDTKKIINYSTKETFLSKEIDENKIKSAIQQTLVKYSNFNNINHIEKNIDYKMLSEKQNKELYNISFLYNHLNQLVKEKDEKLVKIREERELKKELETKKQLKLQTKKV